MSNQRIQVEILETRDKAIKVLCYGKEAWIPRSQIEQMKQVGNKAEILIPGWLFDEKFES